MEECLRPIKTLCGRRIIEYKNLPSENKTKRESTQSIPQNWPLNGEIIIKNLNKRIFLKTVVINY